MNMLDLKTFLGNPVEYLPVLLCARFSHYKTIHNHVVLGRKKGNLHLLRAKNNYPLYVLVG